MILDHTIKQIYMFTTDVSVLDSLDVYLYSPVQHHVHGIIRAMFFLLCGISCLLSRSNTKRGLQILCVGTAITAITMAMDTTTYFSGTIIIFGVFYLLGIGVLFTSLVLGLAKFIPRVGDFVPAMFGVMWLMLYYCFISGKSGDPSLGYFPGFLGFNVSFYTADYAPLFPEMAYILIGASLGSFYKSRFKYALKRLDGRWNIPVCFMGRHALVVYLLQPIIIGGLCFLIF